MNNVILSLGSNMGDKCSFIREAINEISKFGDTKILKISNIYETSPVGYSNQENFYNICINILSNQTLDKLFNFCQNLENKLGRVKTIKNGPRVIDIDFIFFNNATIETSQLTIPHKEWNKRAFVLYPLLEIIDKDYYKYLEAINSLKKIDDNQKIIQKFHL